MTNYIADTSPLEARLMIGIKAKEDAAFQELFNRFRSKIYRTAFRILKEDQSAQDAIQETFMNVHRAAGKFRGDSKLGTWINRIAINACLEILRRGKKHQKRMDNDISEYNQIKDVNQLTPFECFRQGEIRERVNRGLNLLGEKHRNVVRLHDLEGFTIRNIAQQLGVAEGTVKSRLFYGREQLRSVL